jgi:hypothetical protein
MVLKSQPGSAGIGAAGRQTGCMGRVSLHAPLCRQCHHLPVARGCRTAIMDAAMTNSGRGCPGCCPPAKGLPDSENRSSYPRTAMVALQKVQQRGKLFTAVKQCDSLAVDPCLEQAATLWDRLFSGK